jgi:HD-like signal output (HDOD) protein/CheY-like chemotaxis protein
MEQPLKKHILFVDDEPNILEGLRRMLRGMHNEWDMAFTPGSTEALKIMGQKHFDVIVTDMRMPEMDGAQLLTKVKELYPHMVRIILSGHSDKEMVLKTVKPAHQYLSKPCDAEILKSTLSRAFFLNNLIRQNNLTNIILQIETLPGLPALYLELIDLLKSPETSTQQVGEVIAKDLGMTTKILHLVNSAFFSLRCHIYDPAHAVSLLGIDTIKALVLITGVFSQFDEKKVASLEIERLWDHSTKTATMAKVVATREGLCKKDIDDIFMSGLIHDVGKLILADNLPEKYKEILKQTTVKDICLEDAEFQLLGATHAEVGAYLLALWGLPDNIVETVAYHHHPEKSPSKEHPQLSILYVINLLEHEITPCSANETPSCGLNLDYIDQIGLTDEVEEWKCLCAQIEQGGKKGG